MTPDARLFPGITWSDCADEIERERAYRERAYPDRIAQGRMTRADADYQRTIFAAIGNDVRRMAHIGPAPIPPAPHDYSWNERRAALSREIALREKFYPDWVASGRLTQPTGDRQLAAIRAILWRYDCGFDWRPTNGVLDQTAQDMLDGKPRTPQQRETWAEMDAIWRRPNGFYYQRWPDPDAAPAERELALTS